MRTATAAAVAIMMLVVGCGGPSSNSSSPGNTGTTPPGTSATPEPTTEPTSEPSPEPTTPESTQPRQVKPSINLATAPVGGSPDQAAVRQCSPASWLAGDIPPGTTVTLGSVHLKPGNIFKLSQKSCPNGRRKCPGLVWKSSTQDKACYVGVVQVANGDTGVSVVIRARITCATKLDCRSVLAAAKKQGTQVQFTPVELPGKRPTPVETPTPEPTETPATPTGG